MNETKQVNKTHYEFQRYMSKTRWSSVWHQVDEVINLNPQRVLEIGPGPGVFKNIAGIFGVKVETLDIDPDLKPDHVGSATSIPLPSGAFDVVCAFQMLEHLPYESALCAFTEMVRVSRKHVVISLPDAKIMWRYQFHLPKFGKIDILLPRPTLRVPIHKFDGEHFWEIGKKEHPLERVVQDFSSICKLSKTYRVKENPYHRFFIFEH